MKYDKTPLDLISLVLFINALIISFYCTAFKTVSKTSCQILLFMFVYGTEFLLARNKIGRLSISVSLELVGIALTAICKNAVI